jgi:hypothetical protein
MKKLHQRFDTSKPFVQSMIEETNESDLPDAVFTQACEEFGITEEEGMELMIKDTDYEFYRNGSGWDIITK